jgi:TolB-like protein
MTDDNPDASARALPFSLGNHTRLSARGRTRGVLVLVLALAVIGCGGPSVTMDQDRDAFEEEENRLEKRLENNPEDGEALRDLGSIYLRTDRPTQAYDALKDAYSRRPDDPKVLFYLGLASEKVGRREAALDLFQKFDEVPEDSKYHQLMEGRYQWLARKQAERRVQQLVAQEKKRPADVQDQVDPSTVAVVPLAYQGGEDQYQPLGRGLAEMFTTDLANVGRLKVVERVRLQAILNELELARSEYVDQTTAPRVGQLLGAGRVVGGSYFVTDSEELRLQVTLADVATGERIPQLDRQQAGLDELFDLQTELTFSIVDQLGVELTPQERAAIEEVPTQNLQAFLAYSRGLMEEDRGNYGAAAQYYQEAQQIDPDFEQAAQRQQNAKNVEQADGSEGQALASAEGEGEGGGEGGEGGDAGTQGESGGDLNLVQQRQQSMGASTGASTTSDDGGSGEGGERDPAQEQNTAEEESDLEDPPEPPSGSGGNGGS